MLEHKIKNNLLIFWVFIGALPVLSQDNILDTCEECGKSIRLIEGPIKLTNKLRQEAVDSNVIFWDDSTFCRELFKYIGIIGNPKKPKYYIVNFVTIWGIHCHRGTSRLLLFNGNNKFLGEFTGIYPEPLNIFNYTLYFNCDSIYGNKIDFRNENSFKEVLIDGQPYQFGKVK
jgi:hypothetical protein